MNVKQAYTTCSIYNMGTIVHMQPRTEITYVRIANILEGAKPFEIEFHSWNVLVHEM